jgi:hypothetical protein
VVSSLQSAVLDFINAPGREIVTNIMKSVNSVHIFECALESTYLRTYTAHINVFTLLVIGRMRNARIMRCLLARSILYSTRCNSPVENTSVILITNI